MSASDGRPAGAELFCIHAAAAGEGRYRVEGMISYTEQGVLVQLIGGEQPHVGTVLLCQPRASLADPAAVSVTTSVLNLVGHKDDEAARPVGELLAKRLNRTVVVTAGIHIDRAAPQELELLCQNVDRVAAELLAWAERRQSG